MSLFRRKSQSRVPARPENPATPTPSLSGVEAAAGPGRAIPDRHLSPVPAPRRYVPSFDELTDTGLAALIDQVTADVFEGKRGPNHETVTAVAEKREPLKQYRPLPEGWTGEQP